MSRQSDYISEVRQTNRQLWEAINKLVSLQREWNALDYSSALEEFAGENDRLLRADISAVVFDTVDAFVDLLNTGHATNVARLL